MIKNSIPLLLQAANFDSSPCIPIKSLLRLSSLAFIACDVILGSEDVPIQSSKFKCLTSHVFFTMGEGATEKFSRITGTNETNKLCDASHP